MSTLAFLLLTVRTASAEPPTRTLCDGFAAAAQRSCIEQNYPVIHAKVEETCRAKPQGERRTCRTQAYAERGIHYGSARTPEVGGIAPRSDAGTNSTPSPGTTSAAADTNVTDNGTAGTTEANADSGGFGSKNGSSGSTTSSDGGFGSKNGTSDSAGSDGGFGSKNGSGSSGSSGSGGTQRMKALDPTTVTIATVALQTAGYTLQNVPLLCQTVGCTMTKKQQKKLSRWGTVILQDVARVPKILGRKESDADKVTRLLKVTQAIADKAPIGLSGQAKGYVDMALSALQSLVAALGR